MTNASTGMSMQSPVHRSKTARLVNDDQAKRRGPQAKQPYGYGNVAKRVRDMEIMSKTRVAKDIKEPPTVAELQRIAEDIRRGIY
jgi:hypothetical protein